MRTRNGSGGVLSQDEQDAHACQQAIEEPPEIRIVEEGVVFVEACEATEMLSTTEVMSSGARGRSATCGKPPARRRHRDRTVDRRS